MPKKILLAMPLSATDGTRSFGGVDAVCQELLKAVVEFDKTNRYHVVAFDPSNTRQHPPENVQLADNVSLRWYNSSFNRTVFHRVVPNLFWRNMILSKEARWFRPDIAHAHIHSWFLWRHGPARHVLTLHSYKKICRKSRGFSNDFLYEKIAGPLNIRNADVITTVSDEIHSTLKKEGRAARVIPNPLNRKFFAVRREKNISPVFVMAGNVQPRKRVHEALAVLAEIRKQNPELRLKIAGGFKSDDGYYSDLHNYIRGRGLQDHVEFLGPVSNETLCRLYASAAAGLFLSEEETFGLAPLEMMAAGLPVVSTKVGVLRFREGAFKANGARLIDTGDKAAAIGELSDILTRDTGVNEALRKYVAEQFSGREILSAYLKIYY
jgi:glycosyltransferase involved in cell wall biosynthesis